MLSKQEFTSLRRQGLTPEQIAKMDNIGGTQTEGVGGFLAGAVKGAAQTAYSPVQSIGRIAGALTEAKIGTSPAESLGNLASVNLQLIKKAASLPEGDARKQQLTATINENMKLLSQLNAGTKEIYDRTSSIAATPEALKARGTAQQLGYGAEKIAEYFVPAASGAKALDVASKISPKLAQGAASYATRGVGEGLEFAAKTAAQTQGDLKTTGQAFLLGLTMPAITGAVGKAVSPIVAKASESLKNTLPERIYSRIFKTAEDDLRMAYKTAAKGEQLNPTLAREVLDRGLKGSPKNMAVYSFKKLDDLESLVQAQVKAGTSLSIPAKEDYISLLKEIGGKFSSRFAEGGTPLGTRISNIAEELGNAPKGQIPQTTALKLRRLLDDMRRSSSFRLDPALSPREEELKRGADLLRKKLSDSGLADLMNEERVYIEALDAIISDAAKRQNKNIIGLVDLLAGGGGLVSGNILGGVGTAAVIRGFQQPSMLTSFAQGLRSAGIGLEQFGQSTIPGKAVRTAAVGLLSQ